MFDVDRGAGAAGAHRVFQELNGHELSKENVYVI
jgi:hypothetical protein